MVMLVTVAEGCMGTILAHNAANSPVGPVAFHLNDSQFIAQQSVSFLPQQLTSPFDILLQVCLLF